MSNRVHWGRSDDQRDVVHRAVQSLYEGKLVVFPTETVYGLAAAAQSAGAVDRLVALKGRSPGKPLTLALGRPTDTYRLVSHMSTMGRRLVERCWPGPVTLVFPAADASLDDLPEPVRRLVVGPDGIGLRVPDHPAIGQTLALRDAPVVLTSANRSGQPDPRDADQAWAALGDGGEAQAIDLFIDDGPVRFGRPSTVARIGEDGIEVLREGVVPLARLKTLSSEIITFVCTGNTCRSPLAQAIFERKLADGLGCRIEELSQRGFTVMSAGLAAIAGGAAAPYACQVAAEYGASLDDHISQPFTDELARITDRVIVMTADHRAAILERWPKLGPKVSLLGGDRDIFDPIGGPIERYRQCAEQIAEGLHALLASVRSAACV